MNCSVSAASFLAEPLATQSFSASSSLALRALASRSCLGSRLAERTRSFFSENFSIVTFTRSAFRISGTSSTLSNSTSTTAPMTCGRGARGSGGAGG